MEITKEQIRNIFRKTWVSVSPNGVSALFPNSLSKVDAEALNDIVENDFRVFCKLFENSKRVYIGFADGEVAAVQFQLPGVFEKAEVFPPIQKEITKHELELMTEQLTRYDLVPCSAEDWLENSVFENDDPNWKPDLQKWDEFVKRANRLAELWDGYELELMPPDHTGNGIVIFHAPMKDGVREYTTVVEGEFKQRFQELLNVSSILEIDFCCNIEFSAIDFAFTDNE